MACKHGETSNILCHRCDLEFIAEQEEKMIHALEQDGFVIRVHDSHNEVIHTKNPALRFDSIQEAFDWRRDSALALALLNRKY